MGIVMSLSLFFFIVSFYLDYLEFKHDALLNYENKLDGKNELVKVYSKTHRKGLIVARHETGLTVKDRKYLLKSYLEESEAGKRNDRCFLT